ncbi:MAG: type II secretion system F family protein [Anaerolineaceae bacterium]|nr:type II secretion system F family protein [Anaerolineaceae bacterium]MBN2677227.1 type II secretion system F family protein [Anaerolineaceae bacterium]
MELTTLLIIGGCFVFLILIVGIALSLRKEKTEVDERIDKYVEEQKPVVIDATDNKPQESIVTGWINARVQRTSFGDKIARDLAQADLKFKSGEYIALMIIASFMLGLVGYIIGGKSIVLAIAGLGFGATLPRMYVSSEKKKRLIRFNNQLGDMLNLTVNGLRAGFSTMQAMEAISRELDAPISDEFRRVIQEMQLGLSMEKALDNLLRRIPSPDLDLVVTAINVQREVGGNLAEILDTISHTIRERVRVKGEIRVLTSQQSFSGKFLSLLPVFVVLALYLFNKEYILEFTNPENAPCNFIALGLAIMLIVFGYMALKKLAEIEV